LSPQVPQHRLAVSDVVRLAHQQGSVGVAYTYNEPYVGFEFVLAASEQAREAGLKNVLVTNGYYMPGPFAELAPLTDAMNIDLKGIRDEFYKTYCHGELAPVQRTIEAAVQSGIHVEVTNLLVTGLNDSRQEISDLVDYVAGVSRALPLHFSRYFPAYKMDLPPTPTASLRMAYQIGREKLDYVYLGNVIGMEGSDSICPRCGAMLIQRSGYAIRVVELKGRRCGKCGAELNFVA